MGRLIATTPSLIDGNLIDIIATDGSRNRKTGPMTQVWFTPAGMNGLDAIKEGSDATVCGDCVFRGTPTTPRLCYVMPLSLLAATKNPTSKPKPKWARPPVRLGAWGDPGAVVVEVLEAILDAEAPKIRKRHTGYTQRWRHLPADSGHSRLLMASVLSLPEALAAQAKGWRTFRVLAEGEDHVAGEIMCPATEEGGYKATCADCGLCAGTSIEGANIAARVHGAPNRKVEVHFPLMRAFLEDSPALAEGACPTSH